MAPVPDSGPFQERQDFAVELKSPRRLRQGVAEYLGWRGGVWRLKLREVDTISAALGFVGYVVAAEPIAGQPVLPEVTGFRVFDREGECWGHVTRVLTHGPNPLMEVEADNGRQVSVPFRRPIIRRISPKLRRILIDPPAGLRDLNP